MVRSKLVSIGAALLLTGMMGAVANAQGTPTTPPPPPPGQPIPGGGLPPGAHKKIQEIVADGKAAGLTKEQIWQNVQDYLKSIGAPIPHK